MNISPFKKKKKKKSKQKESITLDRKFGTRGSGDQNLLQDWKNVNLYSLFLSYSIFSLPSEFSKDNNLKQNIA